MKTSEASGEKDRFSELLLNAQAERTRQISKEMAFLMNRKAAISRARKQGLSMQSIIDAAKQVGVTLTHHHVKRFVHEELGEPAKRRAKRITKKNAKHTHLGVASGLREHQVTLEEAIAEAKKRAR